jgi:hypothetical protein
MQSKLAALSVLCVLCVASVCVAVDEPAERKTMPVVFLKLGESRLLQHESRARLKTIADFKPSIIKVGQAKSDPRYLKLTPIAEGHSVITLEDEDGTKETILVIVESEK